MLTWYGDMAQESDTAQGQKSLRAVFHTSHMAIVAKSTSAL